jgi:hypothetical protein
MAAESDFLPARHPMRWIVTCNGANFWLYPLSNMPWRGRAIPPIRCATTPNPNRCSKRRSLLNCDSRGQVRRQLTPVLWGKWKECASCFLELCKILHSRYPEHFPQRSCYALSVLESSGKRALIG